MTQTPQPARASEQTAQQMREQAQQMREQAQQAARSARDEARTAVRNAIRDANAAVAEAQQGVDVSVGTNAQDGLTKTIAFPDGNGGITKVTMGRDGIRVGSEGSMVTVPFDKVVPRGIVDMTYAICLTLVLVFVGGPLARAFARRVDRRGLAPTVPPDVQKRLAAIEHAVDTVAIEVERISEGQRYTTKLLAERTQQSV